MSTRPKVLLVPGIGSLVPGSLAPHADRPPVRELLARLAAMPPGAAAVALLTGAVDRAAPPPDEVCAQLAGYAQAVAFCAMAGTWPVRAVRPERAVRTVLLGHSLGELAAFAAAGVLTFEDGARLLLACLRLRAELGAPAGGLLVLRLPAASAGLLLARAELPGLVLACDNGPEQSVVGGPRPAVEALAALARADAVTCTLLPTRTLFHSPELAPVARRVRALAETVAFRAPRVPVHDPLSGRPYRSAAEFRDGVTHHLVHPVPFRRCVALLRAAGVAEFAEAGPRALLSRLTAEQRDVAVRPG
ncbi:acyl transferase domain-containing protein [Kitasatospora sp. GAS204A]|uniref:ACP S-malonyltransferase n=1 Tax=unclassified Kitasatospora TaxID=2633591 RepID=UPI002476CF7B|nr:acyltransferase domain-containing protein [Kitasatospora sp. GAS204B]MDH6121666.1 acyl transferase domain-containing protein [Kitasatospora sp. GAS204B]